ncbi:AAA family ATPase, partial [Halococcus agarilyticus]|uniref:AAA family ATPase n=1 Tax=Halococcus agarilyticus TaxID=1232219 RepID=UPI0012ABA815
MQVLHSIDNTNRELFNKISEKYVEIMDGVTDLTVEYHLEGDSNNEFTIMVEEGSFEKKFNSKEISSGSKEILVLLTQVFLASENTDLLLVEEPELHLHPEAEQRVFDTIQQMSRDDGPQLLVSTHSDVFVNQSEVGDIVRIER